MSGIPLHIQRKFEQRWAAKLASSGASAAPKNIVLKGDRQQLARRATKTQEQPAGAKRRLDSETGVA